MNGKHTLNTKEHQQSENTGSNPQQGWTGTFSATSSTTRSPSRQRWLRASDRHGNKRRYSHIAVQQGKFTS